MTNAEIVTKAAAYAAMSIGDLSDAILGSASAGMLIAFNEARHGPDVRNDIVELTLMLRAYMDHVRAEIDATNVAAMPVVRMLTEDSNVSDFDDDVDDIKKPVIWLRKVNSSDELPEGMPSGLASGQQFVMIHMPSGSGTDRYAVQFITTTMAGQNVKYMRRYAGTWDSTWTNTTEMAKSVYDPTGKEKDVFAYADEKDAAALVSAYDYADTQDSNTLNAAKNYANNKGAETLAASKAYTGGLKNMLASFFQGGDLLWDFAERTDAEASGVTFAWQPNGSLHIDGTPSASAALELYDGDLPWWMFGGMTCGVKFDITDALGDEAEYIGLWLSWTAGGTTGAINAPDGENVTWTVPDEVTNLKIHVIVNNGLIGSHIHAIATMGLFPEAHFFGDTYTGGKRVATEEYADNKDAETLVSAYNAAKSYADDKDAETLAASKAYTDDGIEVARDDYTSVFGSLVSGIEWERGYIDNNNGTPGTSLSKWIRSNYIPLSYQMAVACSLNNKRMMTKVYYFSDNETDTSKPLYPYKFRGTEGAVNVQHIITPPEVAADDPDGPITHIRVTATTSDYDQEGGGINASTFDKYSKKVWITYANLSLLKTLTNYTDEKTEAVSIREKQLESGLYKMVGDKTALTLERGYCATSDGTEQSNSKRFRTGFIPYDENLVIINKSYSGSGKYIQGFVTLYTANEYPDGDEASIYIIRISAQSPGWTNLAANYLNLCDYAWYQPKYFRLSLQWSDGTTLESDDVNNTVYISDSSDGQVSDIAIKQSGTDRLYSADDVVLTNSSSEKTIPVMVKPGTEPVMIEIDASYTLAAGMTIKPVDAELYEDCASLEYSELLNDKAAPGYDEDNLTPYYIKTGEELNGRLEVSDSAGGSAIGWINSVHAYLPKINLSYYSSVRSDTRYFIMNGERYVVGMNNVVKHQCLRMPPVQEGTCCLRMTFEVPSGVTLTIHHMKVRYTPSAKPVDTGVRLDVHGAYYIYPEHTRKAFELATKCGASSMITIPKRSSDGVWFCYHDDTFPGSQLRNNDGTAIPSSAAHYGDAFDTIPFADLKDYRTRKDSRSPLERICLLKDYFDICARNGIKPVLSFHPMGNTMIDGVREYARDAAEIKALAKKCGVLDRLGFKVGSGATTNWTTTEPYEVPLKVLYGVFGNEIDGYIVTIEQTENQASAISRTITVFNSLRSAETPLTVEATIEVYSNKAKPAHITAITEAGYRAGLVQPVVTIMGIDGSKRSVFHSNDYDYWINKGVSRFTTNKTASMGLNW